MMQIHDEKAVLVLISTGGVDLAALCSVVGRPSSLPAVNREMQVLIRESALGAAL